MFSFPEAWLLGRCQRDRTFSSMPIWLAIETIEIDRPARRHHLKFGNDINMDMEAMEIGDS